MDQVVRVSLRDGNRMRANAGNWSARTNLILLAIARDNDRPSPIILRSTAGRTVSSLISQTAEQYIPPCSPPDDCIYVASFSRIAISFCHFRRFLITHYQPPLARQPCAFTLLRCGGVQSTKKESNPSAGIDGWVSKWVALSIYSLRRGNSKRIPNSTSKIRRAQFARGISFARDSHRALCRGFIMKYYGGCARSRSHVATTQWKS